MGTLLVLTVTLALNVNVIKDGLVMVFHVRKMLIHVKNATKMHIVKFITATENANAKMVTSEMVKVAIRTREMTHMWSTLPLLLTKLVLIWTFTASWNRDSVLLWDSIGKMKNGYFLL